MHRRRTVAHQRRAGMNLRDRSIFEPTNRHRLFASGLVDQSGGRPSAGDLCPHRRRRNSHEAGCNENDADHSALHQCAILRAVVDVANAWEVLTARRGRIFGRQGGCCVGGYSILGRLTAGKTHPAQAARARSRLQHQRGPIRLVGIKELVIGNDDGAAVANEHTDAIGARRRFGPIRLRARRSRSGAHRIGAWPI